MVTKGGKSFWKTPMTPFPKYQTREAIGFRICEEPFELNGNPPNSKAAPTEHRGGMPTNISNLLKSQRRNGPRCNECGKKAPNFGREGFGEKTSLLEHYVEDWGRYRTVEIKDRLVLGKRGFKSLLVTPC
ncbi:MAG: hypothetical protein CM15mP106_6050 [Candidatus Neomarinimicrobiota bacterium]|nr:MAG: hypothetical protein CM15mP106_6050 [Candidatus Neomarinimicrobiota bacterium]